MSRDEYPLAKRKSADEALGMYEGNLDYQRLKNFGKATYQSRRWPVVALVTGKTRISHKRQLRLMLRLLAQAGA